jgi:DNA invertase Pin-like site-specific DNA recombinase
MTPTIGIDVGSAPAGHQAAPATVRSVICYTRTANPGTDGQRHLQRQRAKLQAETTVHGWTAWIEDRHQSGTTLDRPGERHALVLLAGHHADALLATDATRLAVDAAVTSQLVALAGKQGWQLLTVTPTPTSTAGPVATVMDVSRTCGPGRGGARR